jgi:hypothetical protein
MGPKAGLDAMEKIKMLPLPESNPGRPANSPSLYRLSCPHNYYYYYYYHYLYFVKAVIVMSI